MQMLIGQSYLAQLAKFRALRFAPESAKSFECFCYLLHGSRFQIHGHRCYVCDCETTASLLSAALGRGSALSRSVSMATKPDAVGSSRPSTISEVMSGAAW